ncbi:hypothetical protein GmHk_08G021121 [Glycine max]|uniref:Uncharacterized protein n=1 Tax=Glycine soja TaxID=3848 RepID=A0A445J8X2_GLYSO|nr:hypothetical protein GmHk_08G021121 [Glycine max]KHN16762.1 hypothetical protein glysoja_002859 [Glycine soja]RZB94840.1 hypothetical protein D0Y65_019368 [Glycine soja]
MILCVLIHNVASKSKKKIGLRMGARALAWFKRNLHGSGLCNTCQAISLSAASPVTPLPFNPPSPPTPSSTHVRSSLHNEPLKSITHLRCHHHHRPDLNSPLPPSPTTPDPTSSPSNPNTACRLRATTTTIQIRRHHPRT